MAEAPFAHTAVPLSHSLGAGTLGRQPLGRNNAGTSAGTIDLKALARLVLARDSRRDSNRDALSHDSPTASATMGQSRQGVATSDPALITWGEAQAERAALVEYDGNIPREWAEGFARLDPVNPPADVPQHRWAVFIDDVGRFLDSGFADQASALGWTPFDLFGADPDKPFARIDRAGLLWLLNGSRLIALTDDAATIETGTGARRTYRRKPKAAGPILAWDLVQR
jgi:hypothetical protein